jgi:uncharacterized protein (DUF2461 family)
MYRKCVAQSKDTGLFMAICRKMQHFTNKRAERVSAHKDLLSLVEHNKMNGIKRQRTSADSGEYLVCMGDKNCISASKMWRPREGVARIVRNDVNRELRCLKNAICKSTDLRGAIERARKNKERRPWIGSGQDAPPRHRQTRSGSY